MVYFAFQKIYLDTKQNEIRETADKLSSSIQEFRSDTIKESLKYTYRISKGKRLVVLFLSIIYFLLNVFFLKLLSGIFKFNPIPPYDNFEIIYII